MKNQRSVRPITLLISLVLIMNGAFVWARCESNWVLAVATEGESRVVSRRHLDSESHVRELELMLSGELELEDKCSQGN